MKLKLIATIAVTSLGALSLLTVPSMAAPKGKGEKAAAEKAGAEKSVKLPMPAFAGLKFGMSLEAVAKLNDADLDADYKPRFLAASPTESLQIEQRLRDDKAVFRRARIEFLDTPTGIDQSALKGEYSYGNKESLARLTPRERMGGKLTPPRSFFFFDDKLWKVYEEYKLGAESPLGADFASAVKALSTKFGGAPKKVAADFQKGQSFDEAVWSDNDKIVRAVDRGDTLGVVYVDKSVQESLPRLRTHKLVDPHELDKDVKAATANPPTQPGPPKGADKKTDGKKTGK